ncbi:S-layer homology domain-containing protein [Thermovenabulum gondwanense]|uniref:Cell surface protein n=1 Tax=Thermovenabulum gondwanense TaxID=520767 RepID=A0A161Q807_9FIRM|nr:S-layer homology domain-containing protein [Thermovenabulum gondwanense]KYO66120.1 Cell surface protein [Thermovenabulum gondwanense]
MKSIKKLLALAIIATLVLGLMPVAFAAAPSDVAGTKYEKAVKLLLDLGVTTGYPDGTFKPANVVTRAEMAAFIVRALGLEEAAKFSAGATQFTDVKAGDWFAGFVNVASTVGVIKGYPDGTFKPNATVTYPEAVTMLVRALGYTDADVVGAWPVNYIVKASQLGVSKDVTIKNEGAVRGDIALLLNNTLFTDMKKEDKDAATVKLIEKGLNVVKKTFVIANIPDFDSSLKEGEFKSNEATNNVYKAGNVDVKALLGMKVEAYVKDGELVTAIPTGNTVITPKDTVTVTASAYKIEYTNDADEDKTIYGTANTFIVFNFDQKTWADINDTYVTMIDNNGDNKVDYIFAKKYDLREVKYVDLANSKLYTTIDSYQLKDAKYTIIKNGTMAKLSDLTKGDIIHVAKNTASDKFEIIAVNKTVEGKVTEIEGTTSLKVYVNGVKYSFNTTLDATVDDNITVDSTYKFTLDKDNKIVKKEQIAAANETVAMVVYKDTFTEFGKTIYKVKLLYADGTEKVLEVKDLATYNAITIANYIKYTTDSNGKINSINTWGTKEVTPSGTVKLNKDNIEVGSTKYFVTNNTVVFYVYNNNIDVVKYSDLAKQTYSNATINLYNLTTFNEIGTAVIYNNQPLSQVAISSDENVILVTKVTTVSDGKKVYGFVKGSSTSFVTKDQNFAAVAGTVYSYKLDKDGYGVNITMTNKKETNQDVQAIDSARIKVNNTIYKLASDVIVYKYDSQNSAWVVGSLADIIANDDTNIATNVDLFVLDNDYPDVVNIIVIR